MVNSTKNFPEQLCRTTDTFCHKVPSLKGVWHLVDELTSVMFPIRDDLHLSEAEVASQWENIQRDFLEIILPLCSSMQVDCQELTQKFFSELPQVYAGLVRDAEIYSTSDPASSCIEEVILCYPGFYAIMVYRIAHIAHLLQIPILPRVMTEYAHSQTGIDINPGAQIGPHLYIDHGTGIVIGETTVIGKNVCIYQGVTLGATHVDKELRGQQRHPIIEDNVIIYAGSTILGGDTVIGHNTVIGGNVWLTESVPPYSTVYHKPEIHIKSKKRG